MAKYRMYKGKKLITTADFSVAGIKHLRESGYAKKKNVSFRKVTKKKRKK